MNSKEQELIYEINKTKQEINKSQSKYFKKDKLKYLNRLEKELRYYRKNKE